jgi:hypothetical protein
MLAVVGGIAPAPRRGLSLQPRLQPRLDHEPMRVLIGLAAGTGLIVLGELAFTKLRGILGHVLVAVGLAIVALALLAATRLYGLVPVEASPALSSRPSRPPRSPCGTTRSSSRASG